MKPFILVVTLMFGLLVRAVSAETQTAEPTKTSVTTDGLVADLYVPAGAKGRLPSIIILGGSEGGMGPAPARDARLLAQHGYATLQVAYFDAPGLPKDLGLIPKAGADRHADQAKTLAADSSPPWGVPAQGGGNRSHKNAAEPPAAAARMGRASIQRPIVRCVSTNRDISAMVANVTTLTYQGQFCQSQKKFTVNPIRKIELRRPSNRSFPRGPNGRVCPRIVSALPSRTPEKVASNATADKISS